MMSNNLEPVPQSGYPGVTWSRGKWVTRQRIGDVVRYFGQYDDAEKANAVLVQVRKEFGIPEPSSVKVNQRDRWVAVAGTDGSHISKSGIRGVRFDPYEDHPPWTSKIFANGKQNHLGRFETAADAALAYCLACCDLENAYAVIRAAKDSGATLSEMVIGLEMV